MKHLRLKHWTWGSPAKFCWQWQVGWWLTVIHSAFRPHCVLTHGFWHSWLMQASLVAQSTFDVHSGNESVSTTKSKHFIWLIISDINSNYLFSIHCNNFNYLYNSLQMDCQHCHASNDTVDGDFQQSIPHLARMDW